MSQRTVVLIVALSACPKPVVPPPAAPVAVVKPPPDPCSADFSGTWVHALDSSWVYEGRDDGGQLELAVQRRFPDAGVTDGGAALVVLQRSKDGGAFEGEVRALGGLPSGSTCPMTFPARVTRCTEDGLILVSAADGVISEGCSTPARPRNPAMLEHKLTRADAGGMRQLP